MLVTRQRRPDPRSFLHFRGWPDGGRAEGMRRLEPAAVADADGVETLIGDGQIAVRHVLEIDRDAVAVVESEAELQGDVEQHARAQSLVVGLAAVELAIVDGGTEALIEEKTVAPLVLPAGVKVGAAGEALRVDEIGRASCRERV